MLWFRRKARAKAAPSFLDRPLLTFGEVAKFEGRMATEGVFCVAELGWGKTWLVFLRFLRAYASAMGGWILGAKPEDLPLVQQLFAQMGASDRLTVIRPGGPHRINWLSELVKFAPKGAATEEVVGGLASLMEIERRSAGGGSSDESHFFKEKSIQLIAAIITVLRMGDVALTATNIYRFLMSLPVSHQELASREWQENSFADQCMAKAYMADLSAEYAGEFEHAKLHLYAELVDLNDRTRSSIVSTVSVMISRLLRGWMGELWGTTTNIDLADAFRGHWFYFDTSPLEFSEYGVSSLVMIKHLIHRIVMRRPIGPDSQPAALMSDEAQNVFVTEDRDFQAVCRSKLCCTWVATQNITGLYACLGGARAAESVVKSWLSLFGCKIFGANTDWDTNQYSSQLTGQTLQNFASFSMESGQQTTTAWDRVMGNFKSSAGFAERYEPVQRPEVWVQLRKPVPPKFEADAIIVMSRLVPLIGQHWKLVTFTPLR